MKKKRWIIGAVVAGALVLVVGILILPGVLRAAQSADASVMQIESVRNLRGADQQLISGSVRPAESENFYVDATKGTVSDIKVSQGAAVRKGDELYVYANPALTIQAEKSRIQLNSLRKDVTNLETKHANIQRDLRRAANTQERDQLQAERDQIRSELEAARIEIRLAELDIEEIDDQVTALSVKSNFDGIVETVNEAERNAVAQGSATTPLIRVVSNLPYEVRGSLTELQRAQIEQGQAFTATAKAVPGGSWRGTVSYVSTFPMDSGLGAEDFGGGTQAQYEFIATLETQEGLVPGNTLFLEINTTGNDDVLHVPAEAVQRDGQSGTFLYVVEEEHLAEQVVTVGEAANGQVAITSPLEDSIEILLNPDPTTTAGTVVIR